MHYEQISTGRRLKMYLKCHLYQKWNFEIILQEKMVKKGNILLKIDLQISLKIWLHITKINFKAGFKVGFLKDCILKKLH